jgi:hypothetical protein
MIKLEYLIDRTSIGYPERIRLGRRDTIMENALYKVCSKSAKDKIENKNADALERGYFLSIQDKINIAARQEQLAQDQPNHDITVLVDDNHENPHHDAFLYNNEIILDNPPITQDDESFINNTEGEITSNQPHTSRKSRYDLDNRRSLRRDSINKRRSQSRDTSFEQNRKVHFNLTPDQLHRYNETTPTNTIAKSPNPEKTSSPKFQSLPTTHINTNHHDFDNQTSLLREQQYIIDHLTAEVHRLQRQHTINRTNSPPYNNQPNFRNNPQPPQYRNKSPRTPFTPNTFTLQNQWPNDFNINVKSQTTNIPPNTYHTWHPPTPTTPNSYSRSNSPTNRRPCPHCNSYTYHPWNTCKQNIRIPYQNTQESYRNTPRYIQNTRNTLTQKN